jgi:hypothetical protein
VGGGGVAQSVGPEFEPQYPPPKKKMKSVLNIVAQA